MGRKLSGLSGSKGSDQWLDAQRAAAEERVPSTLGDECWGPQCSASSSVTSVVTQNKLFTWHKVRGMADVRNVNFGPKAYQGKPGLI